MPCFGPIKRKELIHYLKILGFEETYAGKKHQFMLKGEIVLRILIKVILAENCYREFSNRQRLINKLGRNCNRSKKHF